MPRDFGLETNLGFAIGPHHGTGQSHMAWSTARMSTVGPQDGTWLGADTSLLARSLGNKQETKKSCL